MTLQALTASDYCIIPTQADVLSISALSQINDTINAIRENANPLLSIKGILVTMYNGREIISRDALAQLEAEAERMHTKVFKTKIRKCIAIREAQALRENLITYSPKCNAAADYISLAEEIIHR